MAQSWHLDKSKPYPAYQMCIRDRSGGIHPTQKPVELCEYLIRTYTRPGELVADICAGSGLSLIHI